MTDAWMSLPCTPLSLTHPTASAFPPLTLTASHPVSPPSPPTTQSLPLCLTDSPLPRADNFLKSRPILNPCPQALSVAPCRAIPALLDLCSSLPTVEPSAHPPYLSSSSLSSCLALALTLPHGVPVWPQAPLFKFSQSVTEAWKCRPPSLLPGLLREPSWPLSDHPRGGPPSPSSRSPPGPHLHPPASLLPPRSSTAPHNATTSPPPAVHPHLPSLATPPTTPKPSGSSPPGHPPAPQPRPSSLSPRSLSHDFCDPSSSCFSRTVPNL